MASTGWPHSVSSQQAMQTGSRWGWAGFEGNLRELGEPARGHWPKRVSPDSGAEGNRMPLDGRHKARNLGTGDLWPAIHDSRLALRPQPQAQGLLPPGFLWSRSHSTLKAAEWLPGPRGQAGTWVWSASPQRCRKHHRPAGLAPLPSAPEACLSGEGLFSPPATALALCHGIWLSRAYSVQASATGADVHTRLQGRRTLLSWPPGRDDPSSSGCREAGTAPA